MLSEKQIQLNESLSNLAKKLDITPSKYKDAVERYTAVGSWLESGQYPKATEVPQIYPQGSFRLGTVIRPIKEGKETDYDIDLVCQLAIAKSNTNSAGLKNMVGDRLKENAGYRRMLDEEGRRCWTLEYAQEKDGIGFHMDVLPAIPTDDAGLSVLNENQVSFQYSQHAIDITDKNKETRIYSWKPSGSNPEGYAKWFDTIKTCYPNYADIAFNQKQAIFESCVTEQGQPIFASVDRVPEQLIKTPLQRVIQILKRHRDTHFQNNPDDKPISIIITTLSSIAYGNETELYTALMNIVDKLTDYEVSGLIKYIDGQWRIPNPVNPTENFADRWNDKDSQKSQAFFDWLRALKKDFDVATQRRDVVDICNYLWPLFGVKYAQAETQKSNIVEVSPKPSRPKVQITNPNKPWRP